MNKKFFIQVLKYGLVGLFNTILTALVIWAMLRWVFGVKGESDASSGIMAISNFTGYAVGVINSYIFNRKWTFKSKSDWKIGFLKFLLAFAICYLIQLGVVLLINRSDLIPSFSYEFFGKEHIASSAYLCQLIGIVSYTALNFLFNKYYTFKN